MDNERTNHFLLVEILNALGQGFLLEDMLDQDELFEMQDKIGDALVKFAKQKNTIARHYTRIWDHAFYTPER